MNKSPCNAQALTISSLLQKLRLQGLVILYIVSLAKIQSSLLQSNEK